ncbi:FAD binding domain protein [Colletotrichum higginsianum IMI 349063]|uniref:FAD binding domain protein n=1 Tax=Colletotrichum higginsianum (strain IMI 349063) TaxID=759273 RepID=A0A1B7XV64_COLHI|nr:FAD binding domain protein [Colletotrichum higginsianum IMI 349063]OBR03645.1 FAD binding domain protein [Colletotrichum higginsianum IMI 349063]
MVPARPLDEPGFGRWCPFGGRVLPELFSARRGSVRRGHHQVVESFLPVSGTVNEAITETLLTSEKLVKQLQPWRKASPSAKKGGQLKQNYDRWGFLYGATAGGSEDWYITGQIDCYVTQNGRLCPQIESPIPR